MTIYAELDEMRPWVARGEWDGLEAEFLRRCRRADPEAAARLGSASLGGFEKELGAGLTQVHASADQATKAVFWEFDPDNSWSSAFFLCKSYRPEGEQDDEWAADFDEERVIAGPSAPSMAEMYEPSWDANDRVAAVNVALIAWTIASFGRASQAWDSDIPVCAGYHDQDVVFRVRETNPSRDVPRR